MIPQVLTNLNLYVDGRGLVIPPEIKGVQK